MMDADTITKLVDQLEFQRQRTNGAERELRAMTKSRDTFAEEFAIQSSLHREIAFELERERAAREQAEARLANSIDQNDLLAALERRGFEVSGLDGDESPEDIVANWVASECGALKLKLEAAKAELVRIRDYPFHSEMIGSCMNMADLAKEALAKLSGGGVRESTTEGTLSAFKQIVETLPANCPGCGVDEGVRHKPGCREIGT